ncbi:Transposase, Mutator family [Jhaorihella thermophila]|uniref:Mutator family transposase n=1 Tax=Jhaorihella thermophila TaxID=488547 RepID=A0A1H5Y0F2_9RHOB|nr:Transposase, Mutator family [Jhaorihella thermophila]
MAEGKQCVLVPIGADGWGRKEVPGLAGGYRESTRSRRELPLDLKRRGMVHAPDLATGDGALGFRSVLREVFGGAREQRCRVHNTGNVLNAMPKSVQPRAKGRLHDIWQAETRAEAEAAFDCFVETYGVKYDKAAAKLVKDRDVLLAFYDFPAEQRKHIRTSNPIESTFATVRHCKMRTKGCLSRKTGLAMAFKLIMSAQTRRRKLDGANRSPELVQGIVFKEGGQATSNRCLITPSPIFRHSSPTRGICPLLSGQRSKRRESPLSPIDRHRARKRRDSAIETAEPPRTNIT